MTDFGVPINESRFNLKAKTSIAVTIPIKSASKVPLTTTSMALALSLRPKFVETIEVVEYARKMKVDVIRDIIDPAAPNAASWSKPKWPTIAESIIRKTGSAISDMNAGSASPSISERKLLSPKKGL